MIHTGLCNMSDGQQCLKRGIYEEFTRSQLKGEMALNIGTFVRGPYHSEQKVIRMVLCLDINAIPGVPMQPMQ